MNLDFLEVIGIEIQWEKFFYAQNEKIFFKLSYSRRAIKTPLTLKVSSGS
jgi:hypothetical protein